MADYFTSFSCIFHVGSAENAARADEIRGALAADLYRDEGGYPGFQMQVDHENGPGALWLYSDDYGEPEHVVRFVLRCAEALDLQGVWGFTWALSCSKLRLDAFGCGGHVLDLGIRETVADLNCAAWVSGHVDAHGSSSVNETEGRS
jgi:hypothetical protein